MRKQTLSLAECAEAMRANLISISMESLTRGIQSGIFPFADCIAPSGPNGHWVYLIYPQLLNQWLKEHVEESAYVAV